MSANLNNDEGNDPRFLLPQGVGDTEDFERYKAGGFHPVNLGDHFDGDRYKVVHKLGAGGFSTVWLARDKRMKSCFALKIVDAEHSVSTEEKTTLSRSALQRGGLLMPTEDYRQFSITGPNGHHLCLVLPVLGPAMSDLSHHFDSRPTPSFARIVGVQATRAIANLHAQGFCHGGE